MLNEGEREDITKIRFSPKISTKEEVLRALRDKWDQDQYDTCLLRFGVDQQVREEFPATPTWRKLPPLQALRLDRKRKEMTSCHPCHVHQGWETGQLVRSLFKRRESQLSWCWTHWGRKLQLPWVGAIKSQFLLQSKIAEGTVHTASTNGSLMIIKLGKRITVGLSIRWQPTTYPFQLR